MVKNRLNKPKQVTCIICPMGCAMDVEYSNNGIKELYGNKCKKGIKYATEEIFNPTRTITTTIKVKNGELPLVSVKTDKPVPKDLIFIILDEIKHKTIKAPVKVGDMIIKNIKHTGANIIATKTVITAQKPMN